MLEELEQLANFLRKESSRYAQEIEEQIAVDEVEFVPVEVNVFLNIMIMICCERRYPNYFGY